MMTKEHRDYYKSMSAHDLQMTGISLDHECPRCGESISKVFGFQNLKRHCMVCGHQGQMGRSATPMNALSF